MKYLSHYMEAAQTRAFDEAGAFFAFGQKQFDEKKKPDVKYYSLGAGLICPKDTADKLTEALDNISKAAIKQDIDENGKKAIIHRELANHETQITMDITDTVSALDGYGITAEEIQAEYKEFYQECVDNDCF